MNRELNQFKKNEKYLQVINKTKEIENKMGVSKPHWDFYRHILKSEGVKPEDSAFIDDTEENVVSAKKLGIRSIWFKNSIRLRTDIECHLNQNIAGDRCNLTAFLIF